VVARPGVSDHLPVRGERVPVHARKNGVLAELANVGRDPRPTLNVRRGAIGGDGRSEVVQNGGAVGHVDRLPPPDCKERAETEARHPLHIAIDVAAGVLVEERIDRGGHERTVAAVTATVNLEAVEPLAVLATHMAAAFLRIVGKLHERRKRHKSDTEADEHRSDGVAGRAARRASARVTE
jgi:hypothetical protein